VPLAMLAGSWTSRCWHIAQMPGGGAGGTVVDRGARQRGAAGGAPYWRCRIGLLRSRIRPLSNNSLRSRWLARMRRLKDRPRVKVPGDIKEAPGLLSGPEHPFVFDFSAAEGAHELRAADPPLVGKKRSPRMRGRSTINPAFQEALSALNAFRFQRRSRSREYGGQGAELVAAVQS